LEIKTSDTDLDESVRRIDLRKWDKALEAVGKPGTVTRKKTADRAKDLY
jgi:hypothetical protein